MPGLGTRDSGLGFAAGARAEYQQVLDQWKDADPDLAIASELKREVAKLGT